MAERHNGRPPAEVRLVPMMASCFCIPAGLFVFAWTSRPRLSWVGPCLGGFPVGFGFIFLYNAANNYLVDSYQHQAASALAAKTCIRSFWGAAVVLFTGQMYGSLGYEWAGTLLALVSLACCGIPFVFWRYGAKIRERSKYAYAGGDHDAGPAAGEDPEKGMGKGKGKGKAKAPAASAGAPPREDSDDEDLRRARSYVSNP
ncbi:hypothetical protein MKZ38_010732 [Zalerion maritima]|uniref:Uncharacterized protein n=1 Tax=Zalerion maritima TaxID=339359 RepID=A0AAD5RXY2_9PEZI|nr:hypothetical protein MKZ38_010732 [Zalerion maritima]